MPELYERHYDRIYYNGNMILKRENTAWPQEGSRNIYCNSPLQLVLALVEVIDAMNDEIAQLKECVNGNN